MRAIVAWAIRNAPSMNSIMVAILAIGVASMAMLRRERFPEYRADEVEIRVVYPGASPTETEEGICLKVEEAIRPIPGIKKITARATEGKGLVTAELESAVDEPQRIVNEIRAAVDAIPSLPENIERPVVRLRIRYQSVISVAILAPPQLDPTTDPSAERQFRDLAETIRDELLRLPEVSHADLWQAKPYQIDVEVSEETLREYGLTHEQIADALRAGNIELPAGQMKTPEGDILLRADNRHVTGRLLESIPVVSDVTGEVVTIGDLATVRDGFADIRMTALIDDRHAMSVKIRMTPDEDMLTIREQVVEFVQTRAMPPGFDLKAWDDYSGQARDRLDLLSRNGVYGLLLVFAVLSLFLDGRLAFWVALGIPVSVFGTASIMLAAGETLNIYSMFAFVMALGIVVDDAIVIAENVYAHRLQGKSPTNAAIDGTIEVAPAVISSVLTSVIAFVPLAFVTGEMGKWIAVLPLGLVSMLLVSLAEGLFVLPCHLSHSQLPGSPDEIPGFQQAIQRGITRFIDGVYLPSLRWALGHPTTMLSGSAATLLVTAGIYLGGFTPFVFNPQLDWEFVYTYIDYPRGTPYETIDAATRRLERAFREVEAEELTPDAGGSQTLVKTRYRGVGYTTQLDNMRGEIYAEFDRGKIFAEKSSRDVISKWRKEAGEFPGAERVVFWGINNSPGGRAIELSLLGSDIGELESVASQVKDHLDRYVGVYDIRDSRGPGKWELKLRLRPDAESLGIRLEELARRVRGAFYGVEAMRLQRGRHEVKLMVRYPPHQRKNLKQLEELHVRTADGSEIPLRELAEITVERGYADILRIDQSRAVTITADVDNDRANALEVISDLRSGVLADLLATHPRVTARWEGQQEETRESFGSLMIGFLVAIGAMYVLLTLEFRSYIQPLLILAVLPFGLVGAVAGHLVFQQPLTMFSLFGIVTLSGIVANDSIVLVDFINRRLAAGDSLDDALLGAGQRRFRPVVLTSITTVAALLPLLLERNTQAQVIIPMAISISFGLIVATVWILYLVPTLYLVYGKARQFLGINGVQSTREA